MSPDDLERLRTELIAMERDAWQLGGPPIFETDVYADRLGCDRQTAAAQLAFAEGRAWVQRDAVRLRGPGVQMTWEVLLRSGEAPVDEAGWWPLP